MICRNCGAKLNDGARFCAKCGQKVENVPQGTGMNTPPNTGMNTSSNMYYGQPVNSGNYNQNKPKKKHTALIALAIVLAGIFLLIGIVFISAIVSAVLSYDDDKTAGQSEGVALQEDPYYDDVVRCMQGSWYIWEEDGTWYSFDIDGTNFSEYIHFPNFRNQSYYYSGYIEMTDKKGELTFLEKYDDYNRVRETIYYKYDENTDSIELTHEGYKLERNDVRGRIRELIQGEWRGTSSGNFIFNGTRYTMDNYSGEFLIFPDGILTLATRTNKVLTVNYEYDADTDSIVLTYEGNVLEKE